MVESIADDLFEHELMTDPYGHFARLRAEDPVHWNSLFHLWEITRYDDVAWVLRHPELFTSDKFRGRGVPYPPIPPEDFDYVKRAGAQARRTLINHDRPRHTAERAIVQDHFTQKGASSLRPLVRSAVTRLVDGIQPRGRADLLTAVAPLPVMVFLHLMGLPLEDGGKLRALTDKMLGVHGPNSDRARVADESRQAIEDYFRPLVDKRMAEPTDDLLSALCRGESSAVWTREDLLANATLLLQGGYETTLDLLANGTLAFLRHPDQWALFRDDPEKQAELATEECLRYDSPVRSSIRVATEDIELRGKSIQKHQRVRWWVISANRDGQVFDRPDDFDIRRSPNPHLTFGTGNHYCLGAAIARMEGQEVFKALAQRLPKMRLETSRIEYHPSVSLRSIVSLPVAWS